MLAVGVGLLILVAGGVLLLRLDTDRSGAPNLAIGESARAGDLEVPVVSAEERDGVMRVEVRAGGVDDPEAFADFALVGIGAAVPPTIPPESTAGGAGERPCIAVAEAEQTCTLSFATDRLEGSTRVLLLRRGEDQRRWSLQ